MQCKDISAKLADHLAGTLLEAERSELEGHLASCPACRAELAGLSQTWSRLGDIPAMVADSSAMRSRFEAMLAEHQATPSQARAPATRRPIRSWLQRHSTLQPLLQGCAALLLLVVGIEVGREIRPNGTPEVRELSQEVRDLRQMVTLSLMQQQSASERLKGVSWSSQLDSPSSEVVAALVDALMHDSNVNVRLASIDALKRFAERDVVRSATLRALDTQSSPLVQMALIDFVVETRDREALDTLRRLSHDDTVNATVRARAVWGIDHLEAV
jgi:hypothetical protein